MVGDALEETLEIFTLGVEAVLVSQLDPHSELSHFSLNQVWESLDFTPNHNAVLRTKILFSY